MVRLDLLLHHWKKHKIRFLQCFENRYYRIENPILFVVRDALRNIQNSCNVAATFWQTPQSPTLQTTPGWEPNDERESENREKTTQKQVYYFCKGSRKKHVLIRNLEEEKLLVVE